MPTIKATKSADVPDGDVCVNWAYRTNMPPEQNYRCEMFRDESVSLSARDAQSSGLGYSGGTIIQYRCALFDRSLDYEYGVGPKKCSECRAATVTANT